MFRQYKAHPWHGVSIGNLYPEIVTAFVEIVPTDTVKYEVDKDSGYLSIDRPQKYSNVIPALYGFLPQTYSGQQVAEICNKALGRTDIVGDGDPIDIFNSSTLIGEGKTINLNDIKMNKGVKKEKQKTALSPKTKQAPRFPGR